MKKTPGVLLVTLLLLTSLGFAPAVLADETGTGEADVNIAGMGKLTAEGDGIVLLFGKGVIDVSGNGILWIKDISGDAKINVTGYGSVKRFPDGWVQYSGLHGTASIKGSNVHTIMTGVNVNLNAKGRGKALLWGHGTYSINGKSGQWSNRYFGKFLTISSAN